MSLRPHPAAFAILVGGSIAATLDIVYAILFNAAGGMPPMRLLQVVASGWLGTDAFQGGAPAAALGLLSHFLICYAIAAIFYFAAQRVSFLTQRPVVSGVVFGICVFFVMNFLVLPLSAFPYPFRLRPLANATDLLSHMFFVGVPIAVATRAALRSRRRVPDGAPATQ